MLIPERHGRVARSWAGGPHVSGHRCEAGPGASATGQGSFLKWGLPDEQEGSGGAGQTELQMEPGIGEGRAQGSGRKVSGSVGCMVSEVSQCLDSGAARGWLVQQGKWRLVGVKLRPWRAAPR